ncbi:GrpB family protein [Flocculibacter collagenilyticus]|uniref:GrpB family protein n=1 Tax=Flocculibacter collagenilyticus TaxID=2744479 RepID=UPI001F1746E3|nr:GrpB family protein [Flocculibacter collagenilyticus]
MSLRKIEVINYDPRWAAKFIEEKVLLNAAIGNAALKIEHIGSTAIIGLSAKPIIDILIEVSCLKALDERNKSLKTIGYEAKGENGIEGRRYFQKGGNMRTHHVHAFLSEDENLVRHRAFKEYLIAHPEALIEYDSIKRHAAQECNNDSFLYMSLKNNFIQEHEKISDKLVWQLLSYSKGRKTLGLCSFVANFSQTFSRQIVRR